MTDQMKLMLIAGMLFFGFGYTADGYQWLAVLMSVLAILGTIDFIGYGPMKKYFGKYMIFGSIAMAVCFVSEVFVVMPVLPLVSFAAVFCALLFKEVKLADWNGFMKIVIPFMAMMYALTFILPFSVYGFSYTIIVITLAFMPFLLVYISKLMIV